MPLTILYFGTSTFAVPPLERLLAQPERYTVVAIVTQPDKPAGRDGLLRQSPVAAVARASGARLLQPATLKDPAAAAELAALAPAPDIIIVAAYGKILPASVLALAKIAPLNLHGSLLPSYRGASPIQSALLAGESQTGVTLMRMDDQVDHGPTYAASTVTIAAGDTAVTLEQKLAEAAEELLDASLPAIASGDFRPAPQDHAQATFTKILSREDGKADWSTEDAARIERKIRAFVPWPGLHFIWRRAGKPLRMKIIGLRVLDADGEPGETFISSGGNPAVHAKRGAVELLELQPEGKKPMSGAAFFAGHRDFAGTALSS